MAWGAREHMEWRLQVSKPQDTSHICMNDLGWFQGKQKQAFSNSRRQFTSNARELEEVTPFIQTYTSWTEYEGNAYKVSNTNLDVQHESWKRQNAADGLNSNSSEFPYH